MLAQPRLMMSMKAVLICYTFVRRQEAFQIADYNTRKLLWSREYEITCIASTK